MSSVRRRSTSPGRGTPSKSPVRPGRPRYYTRAEVARHRTSDDLWTIIDGSVFDITKFIARHPGGAAPLRYAGTDASSVFPRIHRQGTLDEFGAKFKIGELPPSERTVVVSDGSRPDRPHAGYYDVGADPDGYDLRRGGEDGREFGDHMSAEGETGHIHLIILLMYGAIGGWAALTSHLTGCHLCAIPLYVSDL